MTDVEKENTQVSKKEIYDKIEELTKKGKTNAEIGLYFKDKLAVPNVKVVAGKNILKIQAELNLRENKLPDDLMALIKKSVRLIKHKEANKKDMTSKKGYQLTISKINRLRKYYIKEGRIPKSWRYSDEAAKLLVK
jgi:small subunit ribosomal protein S15